MRRNKKLAAAAMAVLTASAILTGCGNDAATNATAGNSAASENTDNAGNTGTEGEGEQTASGERPTITFMLQDFTGNALNNENSDKVVEKMEEYAREADKWGITGIGFVEHYWNRQFPGHGKWYIPADAKRISLKG